MINDGDFSVRLGSIDSGAELRETSASVNTIEEGRHIGRGQWACPPCCDPEAEPWRTVPIAACLMAESGGSPNTTSQFLFE